MVKVWEVSPAANDFLCVQPMDLRYFQGRFEGVPMSDGWTTPPFEILNKSKKVADFTSWQICRSFLVSLRARNAIRELCGDDIEFLPFATIKGTELFAVNVLRQLAVIDWSACSATARIGLGPYVFKGNLSHLPPLFKDAGYFATTFANDDLGRAAVGRGLTGLQLADPRKNLGRMIVRGEPINEFPGL